MKKDIYIKKGNLIWISLFSSVVRDEKGNVKYAIAAITDITDKKTLEQVLMQNELRNKNIEKIAHIGSWEMDFESQKMICSDELFRILGLEPDEEILSFEAGLPLSILLTKKNR
ncbi:MAG: PAS domain S-box protein [Bacteroidales bacterium]|nr:PAS domain S-box protein [Bacteroidales bacterium]